MPASFAAPCCGAAWLGDGSIGNGSLGAAAREPGADAGAALGTGVFAVPNSAAGATGLAAG
jgi:hypothetical protein